MLLRRRKLDFYSLLTDQADKTLEGLAAFEDFIRNPDPAKEAVIRDIRKEAEKICRGIIDAPDQYAPVSIGREDVVPLSCAVDDTLDYAKRAAEEMVLFKVPTDPFLKRMANSIHDAGKDIAAVVRMLKRLSRGAEEYVIRIKKTEGFVERTCREALADLYKNPGVVTILKTREIYRHLSNAADRGETAADIIGDILAKSA